MTSEAHLMRWKCEHDGCWKEKNLLDFSVFTGLFPRNINFTDVDGLVELNGKFLLQEWKHQQGLPTGQKLMIERLTRIDEFTVFVVIGSSETMSPTLIQEWHNGTPTKWNSCDQKQLLDRISAWVTWAEGRRAA